MKIDAISMIKVGDEIRVNHSSPWLYEVVNGMYMEMRRPTAIRGQVVAILAEKLIHAQIGNHTYLLNQRDVTRLDPLEVLAEVAYELCT
jgi:hypothetical protein